MLSESQKIDLLVKLSVELNQIKDLDILMEQILSRARLFANADAGSIYLKEGERLVFSHSQNDTLQQRLPDGAKLIYATSSVPVDKNSIAGYTATTGELLNIPDVNDMDSSIPYRFNRSFDEAAGYTTRSMLTIPLTTTLKRVVGVLQIINPQDTDGNIRFFSDDDERLMRHFAVMAAVALERAQLTRNLILRTIQMAELRDPHETGAHVNRVAGYAILMYEEWGRRQGVPQSEIRDKIDILRMAAMLHDVGKVAISDIILKKPAKLTNNEYETMKQHAILGARLFIDKTSEFDEAAAVVALNHHERWDGKGYPGYVDVSTGEPLTEHVTPGGKAAGKKGREIPLFGRIVAIADVFDALSSRRTYKEPWDDRKVMKLMMAGSGKHFDPELLDIFLSLKESVYQIKARYSES
jgi:HD-GYP domain-containing protein (c-di-GMP phosphodiesterase class II)